MIVKFYLKLNFFEEEEKKNATHDIVKLFAAEAKLF
jgi:hypothetical protein